MKIEVVPYYKLRNSTESSKSTAKERAVAAYLYRKPPPTTAEKIAKYWYNNKSVWKYKITLPYYYAKYQVKQVVNKVKKLFALDSGPTFTVHNYNFPTVKPDAKLLRKRQFPNAMSSIK